MSIVQGDFDQGTLSVQLSGRIDSNNASEVEKDIDSLCAEHPASTIVIDAEKLDYISSAGLRILLRLRKKTPNMKVIQATSAVYETFDITGFSEIIPITKAYRSLSVDGCEVLGQGSNGMVYRLDPDTIIKVYLRPNCLEEISRERELARKAFILGIPTAIPYDVVKVDDHYGSVFELLNAESFSTLISTHPEETQHYIALYVDLLKKIHATVVKSGELPDMNATAIGWVNDLETELPADQWKKLHELVSAIPANNHMVHGDYHTKNLMMQNGEVLLIDMDTLATGHPIYEFANMYNAYVGFEETLPKDRIGQFLGLTAEQAHVIWAETVNQYFDCCNEEEVSSIIEKIMVISYTRILRRSLRRLADTDDGKMMIANCREKLAFLLPRVDSLTF